MTRTSYCRAVGLFLVSLALAASSASAQIYVDADCGDNAKAGTSPDCSAPDGPKLTIQAGIDAGILVIVAPGTYNEVINAMNRTLVSSGGAETTIIDGTGLASSRAVVSCCDSRPSLCNEFPPCNITLQGFTVTGGRYGIAPGNGSTIRDSIIDGNTTGIVGIRACDFVVEHSIISNNGSGMCCLGQTPCRGNCEIVNSLIVNNNRGLSEDGRLINSTLVGNVFALSGELEGGFDVINSVIWGNVDFGVVEYTGNTFTNSIVQQRDQTCGFPDTECVDTIEADPLFVDAAAGDYRLSGDSPAIDAGINGPVTWSTDLDGNPRIVDVTTPTVDIGAYEFQSPTLNVEIDIKPDSFPNSVNPYSHGVVPVAIHGSETFDVVDINVTTLAFGPKGVLIVHSNGHFEDSNLDGFIDLVVHFKNQGTGIVCGDDSATLTGELMKGEMFEGSDSIRTVGCRRDRSSVFSRPRDDRRRQPRGR